MTRELPAKGAAATETVLEMARRHVREGTNRVAEQAERIAEMTRRGHDTRPATALLVTLQATLAIMVDDLRRMEDRSSPAAHSRHQPE